MCWPAADSCARRPACASRAARGRAGACLVAPGLLLFALGCASPAGVVFPPLESPRVWPAPPELARIRYVGTITSSADLKAEKSGLEVIGDVLRGPLPNLTFTAPQSIAVGPGALVAVADGAGAAVHILDLDRRTHTLVAGWNDQRFMVPFDVTWVGSRLFVTDAQRREVIELSVDGRFRNRFGEGEFERPVGITYVARRNALYIVDGGAHAVRVYAPDGYAITAFGGRGVEPGRFNFPSYIAVDRDALLVSDTGNFRVQLLDLDGAPRRTIGRKGNGAGDFALPKGVAFDRDGHLYVVDAQFENVQIFDAHGRLLLAFGEEGREPGRFNRPAGIAIGPDDRIWVADSGNHRLQVFEYLRGAS